jgi:hypothetical protein
MIRNLKQLYQSFQGFPLVSNLKQKNQRCSKEENPFLALFADGQPIGAPCNTAFDWNGSTINSSYIIFITGRCGSTLLTHLIKSTQLAGDPDEYLGTPEK